jgi:hypothetical protein
VSESVSVTENWGTREEAIDELVLNGPISIGIVLAVAEKLIRGSMVDDTAPLNEPIRLVEGLVAVDCRKASKLLVATRGAVRARVVSMKVICIRTLSLIAVGFVRRALPASAGLLIAGFPKLECTLKLFNRTPLPMARSEGVLTAVPVLSVKG